MGLVVRKLHNGSTTAVTLTLKDQDGNNISLAGGTLSALLTPSSGTATLTSGALTTSASGIGTITLSAGTLSSMSGLNTSGLVPFDMFVEVRAATSGGTAYREEVTVPIGTRDGEWSYGLTTLAYARDMFGFTDTSNDAKLIKRIRGASQRIRNKCNRHTATGFQSGTYTEEHDTPQAGELVLHESPVTAISSVVERRAGATVRTLASTEYEITSDGKRLRLYGSAGAWWASGYGASYGSRYGRTVGMLSHDITRFPHDTLRVTYTGGYTRVPPDLEDICLELVAQKWASMRRDRTMQSETLGNYSYTVRSDDDVDKWLTDSLLDGGWMGARALV